MAESIPPAEELRPTWRFRRHRNPLDLDPYAPTIIVPEPVDDQAGPGTPDNALQAGSSPR